MKKVTDTLPILALFFVAILLCMVNSYPTGAPDKACKSMVPGHPNTTTTGVNPFKLKLSATTYKPGDQLTGELYSDDNLTFRGFLIEVGKAKDVTQQEEGLGEFVNLDSTTQQLVCGEAGITHTNNTDKQRVPFTWKAPSNSAGDLYVRATVVQSYSPSRYWLGTFSAKISAA